MSVPLEITQRAKEDPVLFAEHFLTPSTTDSSGKTKIFVPHEKQAYWLRNSNKHLNVLTAGNRAGKSTVTAIKHIWKAFYKQGCKKTGEEWLKAPYETLNAAPDYKQALIVWTKIEHMLKNSKELRPFILNITTGTRKDPHALISLVNGSRIHAISSSKRGERIYGFDYDYISEDEAAAESHLEHVVENVLKTRLFDRNGSMDLISTPMGYNKFYDYWRKGISPDNEYYESKFIDPDVFSYNFSSLDNPNVEQELIQQYMASKDEAAQKERIYGLFSDVSLNIFNLEDIEKCTEYDMEQPTGAVTGHTYAAGLDLGRKGDATAIIVMDVTELPYRIVAFHYLKEVSWEYIMNRVWQVDKNFAQGVVKMDWVVDATAMGGDMALSWLNELGIYCVPFRYTVAKKINLINNLQKFLQDRKVIYPDIAQLKEELKFYKMKDRGSTNAKESGDYDTDCVMALGLACWLEREGNLPEPYIARTMAA